MYAFSLPLPHVQVATQGQFLAEYRWFEFRVLSPRPIAIPRLKRSICPIISPKAGRRTVEFIHSPKLIMLWEMQTASSGFEPGLPNQLPTIASVKKANITQNHFKQIYLTLTSTTNLPRVELGLIVTFIRVPEVEPRCQMQFRIILGHLFYCVCIVRGLTPLQRMQPAYSWPQREEGHWISDLS